MKTISIAAVLVASSMSLAMPAMAGGYGNDHFDRVNADAPASQPVQAAHSAHPNAAGANHGDVGGDEPVRTESGRRAPGDSIDAMYRGG
ncbi:hypothetical protein AWB67_03984 [Caballeronia terrestris]|uniref:Uncharacterized protein n=2 Tax=Caballeronia terrestris TaxID=1226301 RepID=A0A158JML0_9BURK|nr:hypothetical protein AWB67_03984 [Caballeronia terrestris]